MRDFDLEHRRRLHLIVIRRDFANFQHLHPEQAADGGWRAVADLDPAGVYRVFADFATNGTSLTLAADLFVAGSFEPETLAPPARIAAAGNGYEVELETTEPREGQTAEAEFTVSRDGRELQTVEPYLGADGHLVALREHDQAFLHTHPQGEPGGAGPIAFEIEYPTPGRTACSFSSRTAARSAQPRSPRLSRAAPPSPKPDERLGDREGEARPAGPGDDLRLLREPDRAQAERARRRRGERQLRDRAGRGRLRPGPGRDRQTLLGAVEAAGYKATLPVGLGRRRRPARPTTRMRTTPSWQTCACALIVSAVPQPADLADRDDPAAAVRLLAVAEPPARHPGRPLGARGRSTGRPGRTSATARRPWTR